MAYTYTPYQQALPDTTLYERLTSSYVPLGMRENPYSAVSMDDRAKQYYADQVDFWNRLRPKKESLDEVLKPSTSAAGMLSGFGSTGGDSGTDVGGRNYYQEMEDRLTELNISEDGMSPEDARAAAIKSTFQIQSANNQKISDALTGLGKFSIAGLFSSLIGGSPLDQRPANVTVDTNAIARAQQEREAAIRAEQIAAQQAAEQAARDAARNVQPVSTYTPTGSASDWSPVDSSGNISWSGQTYAPSAYEGLMP